MGQANMQGGVWGDTFGPAFAAGLGAAAPSDGILSVANPADTTMDVHCLTFNPTQNDRLYFGAQVQHDLLIPATGNCTFSPHVHFTFLEEPADGATVIFKLAYVYAKPGFTAETAGTFAANPTVEAFATYTARAGVAEVRKHLMVETADVAIPVAECGASMVFQYTVKLDSASTVANNIVSLLWVDFHYQFGPFGTIGEYA